MKASDAVGRLADGRPAWQSTYRIRFDEAGPDGLLRTSGFMRFAQDLAWQHSADLGFGRAWYADRGLTWLVRAAELVIDAAPAMGSVVTARTAIVGIRRVFARRRGEFLLADGNSAGWVHTDWVLIDDRGALTTIPQVFPETFGGTDTMGRVGRVPLDPTPADAVHRRFVVRPHELDPMGHANNAVYLDWLEEAILAGGGAVGGPWPRRYRMEFALAVGAGEELDGAAWQVSDGWSYRLAGANAGAERRADAGSALESDRFRAHVSLGARTDVAGGNG